MDLAMTQVVNEVKDRSATEVPRPVDDVLFASMGRKNCLLLPEETTEEL